MATWGRVKWVRDYVDGDLILFEVLISKFGWFVMKLMVYFMDYCGDLMMILYGLQVVMLIWVI